MRATLSSTSSRISPSVASSWSSGGTGRGASDAAGRRHLPAVGGRAAGRRLPGSGAPPRDSGATVGQVAGQLARRRAGLQAHEVGRQLAQPLQARALLGGVLGREQRAPARAEQLDQLDDERVGRERVERAGGAAVQRDEPLDAFARLGRHLRRLGGGRQAGDQIQLAPARDLDHARQVGLAQLDRRARQRAHDGGRVLRIDQQAHPREHVAHLRARQEVRRTGRPARARRPGCRRRARSRSWRRAPSKDTSASGKRPVGRPGPHL